MENEYSIFPEEAPVFYATFWSRFWAAFIDSFIISVAELIIYGAIGHRITTNIVSDNHIVTVDVVSVKQSFSLVAYLYYAIMESSPRRATFGKRFMNLEVTNMKGGKLNFFQATIRFWGKFISAAILFIGYFMNIWDSKGQTLHDNLANALVVQK